MLLLSEVKEHKNHGMTISWGVIDGFRRSKLDCSTSMEAHNLALFTHGIRILDVHSSATNCFISCKVKLTLKLEFICLDVKRNDWLWPAAMYEILWLVWVCNLVQTDACNLPTNKLKICTVAFFIYLLQKLQLAARWWYWNSARCSNSIASSCLAHPSFSAIHVQCG